MLTMMTMLTNTVFHAECWSRFSGGAMSGLRFHHSKKPRRRRGFSILCNGRLIVPAAAIAVTAVILPIARIAVVIARRMMLSVIPRIIIRAIVPLAAIVVSGRMAGALMSTIFGMIAIRHRGGRKNHEKGERKQKNAGHHRFPLVVAVAALVFSA